MEWVVPISAVSPNTKAECRDKLSTQHLFNSAPLKTQESGPLERQPAPVTFDQITKLVPRNVQLQPVAAFKLERGIIRGIRTCVMNVIHTAVMMVGGMLPFGDNRSLHRQPGRMVVPVPLANTLYEDQHEDHQKHHKWQGKQDIEHGTLPFLTPSYHFPGDKTT